MVQILNLTGTAWPALTDVDLHDYAPPIGRLIAVRILSRATQTVTFTGSAIGAHSHTFTGSAQAAHRHLLRVEISNPASAAGGSLPIAQEAGGLLKIQTPISETFPTAIDTTGPITPAGTLDGQGAVTPVGTVGNILGMVYTAVPLSNNGRISAGATAAANSGVLSGRQAINLGVAVDSNSILQVQVLTLSECGGIF